MASGAHAGSGRCGILILCTAALEGDWLGASRGIAVRLPGHCELSCSVCDCRNTPTPASLVAELSGAERLVIRGAVAASNIADLCSRARSAGVVDIAIRSPLLDITLPTHAVQLRNLGVSSVMVPLFSARAPVHDRIAGKQDTLVRTLVGMRACADAGLAIELEIPLLPARLQNLTELLNLAKRAVPELAAAQFLVPAEPQPRTLVPESWDRLGPHLVAAIRHCQALDIAPKLPARCGIPPCVFKGSEDLMELIRYNPHGNKSKTEGFARGAACGGCSARFCPGIREWHLRAGSDAGLQALNRIPATLKHRDNSKRRRWNARQREHAKQLNWLILRPTVNCNQDCVFCSVNETAQNHWEDPDKTYRLIARAARRGVQRVNFTGGEPTLSPRLADFIEVARRCGIPEVDLCTNAVSLTSTARVEKLVNAGLTHAFISLHAHDEALSQVLTLKQGDFERTLRGTKALIERGVLVTLNHVINTRNFPYLTQFVELVRERFDGKPIISFTMITPQYRALENVGLIPKLSEVSPHLMRAAHRCIEIGQPFYIGARQGTPPCFLGPFRAWSDILFIEHEAVAEDAEQKVRAAQCDECRYSKHCTGVWRPYAERYGLDELKPLRGPPINAADFVPATPPKTLVEYFPKTFEEAPSPLRDPDLELKLIEDLRTKPGFSPKRFLPVLPQERRSRPDRVLMFGSSGQARRLGNAITEVEQLVLDAVVSPHMHDWLATSFDASGWNEAAHALDVVNPDLVVIAAATRAHRELAELCIKRGHPVLVEKPVGETIEDTLALEAALGDSIAMPAHNVLFAPGLLDFLDRPGKLTSIYRRLPPHAPGAPTSWNHQALSELVYHQAILASRQLGGAATLVSARYEGAGKPLKLAFSLTGPEGQVELKFDYTSDVDELEIIRELAHGVTSRWLRSGQSVHVGRLHAGSWSMAPVSRSVSEHANMLRHFQAVIRGDTAQKVSLSHAVQVKQTVAAIMVALGSAGAPFQRPEAPRHVASRDLAPKGF